MSTPEFPTTEFVRSAWLLTRANHDDEIAGAVAEFNDWLESVKYDAYAAGADAGYADGSEGRTGDDLTHNPHGSTL